MVEINIAQQQDIRLQTRDFLYHGRNFRVAILENVAQQQARPLAAEIHMPRGDAQGCGGDDRGKKRAGDDLQRQNQQSLYQAA